MVNEPRSIRLGECLTPNSVPCLSCTLRATSTERVFVTPGSCLLFCAIGLRTCSNVRRLPRSVTLANDMIGRRWRVGFAKILTSEAVELAKFSQKRPWCTSSRHRKAGATSLTKCTQPTAFSFYHSGFGCRSRCRDKPHDARCERSSSTLRYVTYVRYIRCVRYVRLLRYVRLVCVYLFRASGQGEGGEVHNRDHADCAPYRSKTPTHGSL